ncbi:MULTISPECIES: hypothetical protein [Sphingomonas]|jgi:hypothetical protein|uniref:hypothetical protein n=1 Tax=Sphingomonas TaxID=13687 RepID=UPI00156B62DE|nr:hypothetical protein [Sphingomonas turrisvirgatae]
MKSKHEMNAGQPQWYPTIFNAVALAEVLAISPSLAQSRQAELHTFHCLKGCPIGAPPPTTSSCERPIGFPPTT